MNVAEIIYCGKIAVLDVRKAGLMHMGKPKLETVIERLRNQAVPGVIVDLSHMGPTSYCDLGRLVELFSMLERARCRNPKGMIAALCGVSGKSEKRLACHGLLDLLPVFPTRTAALRHKMFRPLKMAGAGAILLCAPRAPRMGPLTSEMPVPMLDFLGKPIITRVMDQLSSFGVTDFIVNTGYLGHQIRSHLRLQEGFSKFYVDDSSLPSGHDGSIDTIERLSHLSRHHSVFEEDRLVLSGNAITDVDLSEMMAFHKSVQADVTLSVCGETSANTGVMILGAAAQDILNATNCTGNMLEFFKKHSARVHMFVSRHRWFPIRSGAEYFRAHQSVLQKMPDTFVVSSAQKEKNLWVEPSAHLGRRISVNGCSYIGAGARVSRDVMFKGNCFIGANCRVLPKTLVSNSLIFPDTQVEKRTIVDHMIAGPHWAINHNFADGRAQNKSPLTGLGSVQMHDKDIAEIHENTAKIA